MKPMMTAAIALAMANFRLQERTFYSGDCPPLPPHKNKTGSLKIRRAARKRRNARRGRA